MGHFGENVFDQLFGSVADTSNRSISLLFDVFGLTTFLVMIFTILYIASMLRKKHVFKETKKKMILEKSYRYL